MEFSANDIMGDDTTIVYNHSGAEPKLELTVLNVRDISDGTEYGNVSLYVAVEAVDDVAAVWVSPLIVLNEGDSRVIDGSMIDVTDPDTSNDHLVLTVTSGPFNGTLG